ncbi:MAG TPA: hypothetical protein VFG09_13650 [Thermodesulfovibrionales bacterium]|jgi:hypothetical protein|nr:hypothetical protein [Thermodesulfovibrionales bacterium]
MDKRTGVRQHLAHGRSLLDLFAWMLVVTLIGSCSTKRIEVPTYEGVDPGEELAKRGNIRSIRSTFAIEFEKDGGTVKGDAVLRLTSDALDLQVYSLGFLVAEITANDTVTRSNPPIDRNRIAMLVDGIRNSFFWWSIKDYDVREDENLYRVSNSWRRLFLNKRTLLPERQVIDLEDGRELNVLYEEPDLIGDIWFPSRIRIELSRYSVHLRIKTLAVTPE